MEEIEITLEQESNEEQEIELISEGTLIYPSLENLTVTPSTEEQIFNHPNSYGYDNVVVEAVETEELNITPNTEEQVKEGMFNKVTVAGIKGDNLEVAPNAENQEFNGLYSNVTVAGDSDLLPENIKSGVNIFGVEGTGNVVDAGITDCSYLFYYGARKSQVDEVLALCNNVTNIENMYAYSYGDIVNARLPKGVVAPKSANNAFANCSRTAEIDCSNLDGTNTTTFASCFYSCSSLKKVIFPTDKQYTNFTSLSSMFNYCGGLLEVDLSCFVSQKLTNVSNMFQYCSKLPKMDLSPLYSAKITSSSNMFANCSALTTVIINNDNIFPMTNVSMFNNTPIKNGTGYVYVRDSQVTQYQQATNWSTYATQIKPLSEYEGDYYGKA